jgi:hypothetical protein
VALEASWTRLAASIAFAERVELFLHTQTWNVPPVDICGTCYSIMRLKLVESRCRLHGLEAISHGAPTRRYR